MEWRWAFSYDYKSLTIVTNSLDIWLKALTIAENSFWFIAYFVNDLFPNRYILMQKSVGKKRLNWINRVKTGKNVVTQRFGVPSSGQIVISSVMIWGSLQIIGESNSTWHLKNPGVTNHCINNQIQLDNENPEIVLLDLG